jgi:hypothetical protein
MAGIERDAARAVLTAVTLTAYDVPPEGLPAFAEEMAPLIAAALRAAADQLYYNDEQHEWLALLNGIADELENN